MTVGILHPHLADARTGLEHRQSVRVQPLERGLVVVDAERNVLRRRVQDGRRLAERQALDAGDQVDLGFADTQPRAGHAQVGPRSLAESEDVAIEGEGSRQVANGERDMARAAGNRDGPPQRRRLRR